MGFGSNGLLTQIGNTPLLKIVKLEGVEIYAKAEWFNPGGSVKDRPALWMIEDGERSGRLTRGKVILDATSGNMGIALAMIGAVKGYRVELVMPGSASEERKKILRAYGAEIRFSDPLEGSDGAILEARRLRAENPERYFYADQYNNPSNPRAHYAGIGTGGTIMGTGRRLKEYNKEIRVIAVEPDSGLHGLEGLKHMETSIVPGVYDEGFQDGKIRVSTEEAYEMVWRLAREEGLLAGLSSGAALKGALEVAIWQANSSFG
jgi:cysteine synthase B